jgi:hypothetical protein
VIVTLIFTVVAAKLIPVTFALCTVTDCVVGRNVYPVFVTVTVYVPFDTAGSVNVPVDPVEVVLSPVSSVTVAPATPHAPDIVYLYLGATVTVGAVTSAPDMVTVGMSAGTEYPAAMMNRSFMLVAPDYTPDGRTCRPSGIV